MKKTGFYLLLTSEHTAREIEIIIEQETQQTLCKVTIGDFCSLAVIKQ